MIELLNMAYDIFVLIAQVSFGATGLTIVSKTNSNDEIKGGILKVLNFVAGNFGKNKNADDNS